MASPTKAAYCPERGDVVWMDFDPIKGREQGKRRPALVLSGGIYNRASGLCLVCPITSKLKGYPFEVAIASPRAGVVLSDQIRSLFWEQRNSEHDGRAPPSVLVAVQDKIKLLVL